MYSSLQQTCEKLLKENKTLKSNSNGPRRKLDFSSPSDGDKVSGESDEATQEQRPKLTLKIPLVKMKVCGIYTSIGSKIAL